MQFISRLYIFYLFLILSCFSVTVFAQKQSSELYLVGEGFAENTGNPDEINMAKDRAMADLANQIAANVKSEFINEVTETSNTIAEYAASKVKVISDMRLEGVRYEVDKKSDAIHARAILNKMEAADLYYEKTRQLSQSLQGKMSRINQLMQSNDNESALRELFEASRLFNEVEQNVLLYMILGGREQDKLQPAMSRGELDDKILKLTEKDFKSFDDAINGLCFQISKQVKNGSKITVYPFEFQDTSFGSEISDYIRQQINYNLTKFIQFQEGKIEGGSAKKDGVSLAGNYWLRSEEMEILATMYDENGKTFGSARVKFPKIFADQTGIAYKPQNFEDAMSEDKYFAKNEVVYGDLNVEFWTNKGNKNLIFKAEENMKIFVRVNTPSYIRFIYHLANGMRTPLIDNYFIDQSKVNKAVELPEEFVCAAPFGVEKIQIFASTETLPPFNTRQITIEGEQYDVLSEDLPEFLTHTRGMLKKKGAVKNAERVLTITTVKKQ
jgi:hypothetical protein